jgi:LacI family transcriptional regulator, galactose operon repressor
MLHGTPIPSIDAFRRHQLIVFRHVRVDVRTDEAGGGNQPLFERRPRVAEVAARAGVSTATVDRVINARGGVRKKTVALVEKAIREIVAVDRGRPSQAPSFDIFLPANSGRSTELLAEAVSRAGEARGAQANITFVERMNPSALAHQLLQCAQGDAAGVAFQALDHPLVREAVNELSRAGIPVVTLCSDIGDVERLAYIGIDNRAAGRTAGFLMGRFCCGPGKLAVVWGGQLYRSHEEREIGFRSVLRHDYPALQIIEAVNGNDDPGLTFACVSDLIARHPDLLGVYCVGGGQGAVAAAIETAGLAQKLIMIGHNFNDETKPFVLSGTIDAIIHQDMVRIADAVLSCLLGAKGSPVSAGIPIEIITRENLMHR